MKYLRGVLDTSTVVRLHELEESDLPEESLITAITLAELSVGPLVADDAQIRADRQLHAQVAESSFGEPLPFDSDAARSFGEIAAQLRGASRKSRVRAFDALIAATAKSAGLPVFTFNPADFAGIAGLEVVPLPVQSSAQSTT